MEIKFENIVSERNPLTPPDDRVCFQDGSRS